MSVYKTKIAVAGAHGKTTTTGMLWEALLPLNPTVHIGGNYNDKSSKIGGGRLFITEACEYKRSFLNLYPDIAVILNIDLDHTDCYADLEDMTDSFKKFASNAGRLVIVCGDQIDKRDFTFDDVQYDKSSGSDCENIGINIDGNDGGNNKEYRGGGKGREHCRGINGKERHSYCKVYCCSDKRCGGYGEIARNNKDNNKDSDKDNEKDNTKNDKKCADGKKTISVGLKKTNDYYATCLSCDKFARFSFCVHKHGIRLGRVSLSVAGVHNVINALSVIAVCDYLNMSFGRIAAGLFRFKGMQRRMEFLGYKEGTAIFSDYAHHHKEIEATIEGAKASRFKHITAVFEPHTFTRTKSFCAEFALALSAADSVVLLPVYPAREKPIEGVSSELILNELKKLNKNAVIMDDYQSAHAYLKKNLPDDGVILFMGAGTIDNLAREFMS